MRHVPETFTLILALLLAAPVPADDAAREIVERGMKARSDKPELLEKQRCSTTALKGKMAWLDDMADATGEFSVDWPACFRCNYDIVLPTAKTSLTVAIKVDKGWQQKSPDPAVELNVLELEYAKAEMYGRWLATLYPLKDKAFTFTSIKDGRVGDEDVAVVKVTLRLRPDVYLSFSKKTNQLLKVVCKARVNGLDRRFEYVFSDYKTFDGLTLPTKMVDSMQIGTLPLRKSAEWTVTGYKFLDKMGDDTFAMPVEKKK